MADNDIAPVQLPPWYVSKTTWSMVLTAAATLLNQFGVQLDPDFVGSLANWLADGGILFGFAASIYLHWKAKRDLAKQSHVVAQQAYAAGKAAQ